MFFSGCQTMCPIRLKFKTYCCEFAPARRAISRSTRMATESPTGRTIQLGPFWDYRQKPVTGGDLTPPLPSPPTIRVG